MKLGQIVQLGRAAQLCRYRDGGAEEVATSLSAATICIWGGRGCYFIQWYLHVHAGYFFPFRASISIRHQAICCIIHSWVSRSRLYSLDDAHCCVASCCCTAKDNV